MRCLIAAGLLLLGCTGSPFSGEDEDEPVGSSGFGAKGGSGGKASGTGGSKSGSGGSSSSSGGDAGEGSGNEAGDGGEDASGGSPSAGGTTGGSGGAGGSAGSSGGAGGSGGSSNAGNGGSGGTGCQPLTYDQVCPTLPDKTCGLVDNGCGGDLDCGGCDVGAFCVYETNTCKATSALCQDTKEAPFTYCVVSSEGEDPVYCSAPGDPDGGCTYDSGEKCYFCNGATP